MALKRAPGSPSAKRMRSNAHNVVQTVDSAKGTRSSPPNVPPDPGVTPGPQEGLDTLGPDQPSTSNVLGIEAPSLPEKDPPDTLLEPNRPPNAQIPDPSVKIIDTVGDRASTQPQELVNDQLKEIMQTLTSLVA
ncbi:uncharacterized protein EI90DRAFT_3118747 [Cantharellus anzutake]|uniref:uncharacterized protein n=1 Tax=Cantharellus anzutake TaxID=1750568 RepID=UPI001904B568|nr:uncharacterized protein EI90DRAFT_3118747 [Cantharellus anzutake]KAF8337318.1 hypothetical protein EI90DRAFT_3118747 [Cantharellus anzutake]